MKNKDDKDCAVAANELFKEFEEITKELLVPGTVITKAGIDRLTVVARKMTVNAGGGPVGEE